MGPMVDPPRPVDDVVDRQCPSGIVGVGAGGPHRNKTEMGPRLEPQTIAGLPRTAVLEQGSASSPR